MKVRIINDRALPLECGNVRVFDVIEDTEEHHVAGCLIIDSTESNFGWPYGDGGRRGWYVEEAHVVVEPWDDIIEEVPI